MHQKPDFKTAFLALMDEESPGGHPSGETLAAYRGGELNAEEQASIDSHLAECRECTELAQDLDLFTEPERLVEEGDEFEVATFLRTLKPQLASENSTRKIPWFLPLAVAASLALAVMATWWLSRLVTQRQMLADLSAPRINVQIIDLLEDVAERGSDQAASVEIDVSVDVTLVFTPDDPGDYPSYRLDVLDASGALVHSFAGLEMNPYAETLMLGIPPGGLAAGSYRLELHGVGRERVAPIANYLLRVVDAREKRP